MTRNNFNTISNFGMNTFSNNMSRKSSKALNPLIKLNGGTSLMGSIDKLSLITEREEKLARKTRNLFKKNQHFATRTNSQEPKPLEEINKFTSQILNKNWSNINDIINSAQRTITNTINNRHIANLFKSGIKNQDFRSRVKGINQLSSPALDAVHFFK